MSIITEKSDVLLNAMDTSFKPLAVKDFKTRDLRK